MKKSALLSLFSSVLLPLLSLHGEEKSAAVPQVASPTLAQLEDQERKIRVDATISREQKLSLLHDIWAKETALAGNAYGETISKPTKSAIRATKQSKISDPVIKKDSGGIFSFFKPKPKPQTECPQVLDRAKAIVSVLKQQIYVFTDSRQYRAFPVSTSKYGLGDDLGSYKTPLGLFVVKTKIGKGLKPGEVLKSREPTGEVVQPNAPDRDPIVTRIIWLQGLEKRNQHAYERCIYIHGTPQENELGHPASYGCVRMASQDVIKVYEMLPENTRVAIIENIDDSMLKKMHFIKLQQGVRKEGSKT